MAGTAARPTDAIAGAVLLFVGTYLHPMSADPNVPLAAFTEYASSGHWVAIHLMQLFGVVLIAASLVLLSRRMADGPAAECATLGAAGAIASVAIAAALQAVDGVALKFMFDMWAATPEPAVSTTCRASFFYSRLNGSLRSLRPEYRDEKIRYRRIEGDVDQFHQIAAREIGS